RSSLRSPRLAASRRRTRPPTLACGSPLNSLQRSLPPRNRHRRAFAVPVASLVGRPVLKPPDEPCQLLDRLLIHLLPLLRLGQFRLTQHAAFRVTARPGDDRRRPRREQIDPVERAVLLVEADHVALDQVLAHVVAIEI